MNDLAATRRANLLAVLKTQFEGNQSALAHRAGDRKPGFINELLRGRRTFGEKLARSIEEQLGLANGSLDLVQKGDNVTHLKPRLSPKLEWPFDVPFERFAALNDRGKQRVEGAVLAVIQESEKEMVTRTARKKSTKS